MKTTDKLKADACSTVNKGGDLKVGPDVVEKMSFLGVVASGLCHVLCDFVIASKDSFQEL